MYLSILKDEMTKCLMLHLAVILCVSNQEEEPRESAGFQPKLCDDDHKSINYKNIIDSAGQWKMSDKEHFAYSEYRIEMKMPSDGNIISHTTSSATITKFADLHLHNNILDQYTIFSAKVLQNIEGNEQYKTLSALDKRKHLIEKEIRYSIKNLEEQLEKDENKNKLSIEEKKAIIFELISLAYVDGDYSHLEEYTIKVIVDAFEQDEILIDEMLGVVKNMQSIYNKGLELITE